MAVLNTIRNKSGLLLAVILLGAVLFIVGPQIAELFSNSGVQQQFVGEINGEEIPLMDYAQELKRQESIYEFQNNQSPQEQQQAQLKYIAWNQILFQKLYGSEFEKLGILITRESDGEDNEENDMLNGDITFDESIKNIPIFKNERGEFNKLAFSNFLYQINHIDQIPENQRQQAYMMKSQWTLMCQGMYENRLRQKYSSLLSNSIYVTQAEAEQEYEASEKKGTFNYIHIPLSSVSDSSINVTDDDLQEYLDEHEKQFQVSENRVIDYVAFKVSPSDKDAENKKKEVESILAEFKIDGKDSTYAKAKTDIGTDAITVYTKDDIPVELGEESLVKNEVYGPFLQGRTYKLYKYLGITTDTSSNYLFAEISLEIKPSNTTSNAIYRNANAFAKEAINAKDFNKAVENNEQVTKISNISINPNNNFVGGLGSAKEIVRWAYNNKEEGTISKLFKINNQYVVVNLSKVIEEDVLNIENLREQLTVYAKQEAKKKFIKEKIASLNGTLVEIKDAYNKVVGKDVASVVEGFDVSLASSSIGSRGVDPSVVGGAFAISKNSISKVYGDNGVYVFEAVNIEEAKEIADYTSYKTKLQSPRMGSFYQRVDIALRDISETKNKTYLSF